MRFGGRPRKISHFIYMQTDVTQSAGFYKLWAWFETNKKQVSWGATGLLVVGLITWFWVWRQSENEVSASEALSNVSTPQLGGAGARPNAADAYLKVAASYPNSSAAARAQLLAAGSLFVEGKYADAQAQFEKFMREHRDSPFIAEALLGNAASLDAQGKTNEAMAAYTNIKDRHPNEYVAAQAKFVLAGMYEAQNKPEQARSLFEEIAHTDPYGSLGSEAGMRSEELKIKHPNLVAPTTTPTNAAPLKFGTP